MPLSICLLSVILSVSWLKVNVSCLSYAYEYRYMSPVCHPVCDITLRIRLLTVTLSVSHASEYVFILSVIISVSRFFPYFFILLCLILLSMSICRGWGGPYFLFNDEKLYSCLQMHFFNPCQFVLEQWLADNYLKTYTVYISIVPVAGVLCVQAFPSFSSACILVIINIMR